jgi:TatD DNase family protein
MTYLDASKRTIMEIFDSHCHLFLEDFDGDRDEVYSRAKEAGVTRLINVGLDVPTTLLALEHAGKGKGFYASAGLHPHNASSFSKEVLEELVSLCKEDKIVGFGEIGLDFYRNHSPKEDQIKAFRELLNGAIRAQKPAIIHTRDAHADTLAMLKDAGSGLKGALIHCFTGTAKEAEDYLEIGASISIPGVVTFKKAQSLRDAVRIIPKERLLIETDSPYLAPQPFRGKRNEPSYLKYHLEILCEVLGMSLEETASLTARNAMRFFEAA